MFEDLIDELNSLEDLGELMASKRENIEYTVSNTAQSLAEARVGRLLIQELNDALMQVDEYGDYAELSRHILSNFEDWRHHVVDINTEKWLGINPRIAGTEEDLTRGQMAAWGPKTAGASKERRAYGWKFGIYRVGREGHRLPPWFPDDYPTYEEIISQRLQAWGDKAPYWILLNDGNQSNSDAYPSFPGTGFVDHVRAEAPHIIRRAKEYAERQALSDLRQWEEARLFVGRARGHTFQIERKSSSKGLVWYQLVIDGKYGPRVFPDVEIVYKGRPTGLRFEF